MRVLVDTNVLLRHAESDDPLHDLCRRACRSALERGDVLVLVPQVLFEFFVVATRPKEQNGWGMSAAEAAKQIAELRATFPVLTDTDSVLDAWIHLVNRHDIRGKRAHDARLAAAVLAHGIDGLLTLNAADFAPFAGVQVLDPRAQPRT